MKKRADLAGLTAALCEIAHKFSPWLAPKNLDLERAPTSQTHRVARWA